MNIDPVSGNEIPPGASANEVRDDVPILASENEYVIPANVVRYLGLDRIERMVKNAKKALQELDAQGRIGGSTKDDLPFSAEELQAVDEEQPAPQPQVPQMAAGGMVKKPADVDPLTGLPLWLLDLNSGPAGARASSSAPMSSSSSGRTQAERDADKPTGLAGSVTDWTPDDFTKYAIARNSVEQKFGQTLASYVPFGGIMAKARERYLERNVPRELEKMISTGMDLQGNPLDTTQIDKLRETYNQISSEPLGKIAGVSGVAKAIAEESGLIKPKNYTAEDIKEYNEKVRGDSLINRGMDKLSGAAKSAITSSRTKVKPKQDDSNEEEERAARESSGGSDGNPLTPETSQRPQPNPLR